MNDSPGWAPPGSSPSDEPERGTQGQGEAQGRGEDGAESRDGAGDRDELPGPASAEDQNAKGQDEDRGQDRSEPADQSAPGAQWSRQQPPPGQWSAPMGGDASQRQPDRQQPPPPAWQPPPSGWQQAPPPGWQQPPHPSGWQQSPPPAPGGWGAGWTHMPPAARPGVIPLRPLGVGEILDGAVSTMRAHWRTVLGISLAVAFVTQAASTVVEGIWFQDSSSLDALDDPDATLGETWDAVGGALGSSAVTLLIAILGTIVTTGLLTIVAGRAVLGRSVTAVEAWRGARPHLPQLCGLLFLLPLIVAGVLAVGMAPGLLIALAGAEDGGAALAALGGLAGAVVAVWLWVRLSLAAPALMLEKQGVLAAMRRSGKLVRGAWWRVLGVQLLALVIVFVIGAIIEIPTSIVAMVVGGDSASDWLSGDSASVGWAFLIVIGIGGVISSAITFPITAGVMALLYMDQRIRREALDLELARAAGLEGYGTNGQGSGRAVGSTPGS